MLSVPFASCDFNVLVALLVKLDKVDKSLLKLVDICPITFCPVELICPIIPCPVLSILLIIFGLYY